jgi:hypothetical protein
MSEFDVFDVRKAIDDGVKIDLKLPDGSDSGKWLRIRNFRSQAYRDKLDEIGARIAEQGKPDAKQRHADRIALLSSLIAEWNFETKLTPQSAADFLEKAILVREQIDRACLEDDRFFGKGAAASSSGPKQK